MSTISIVDRSARIATTFNNYLVSYNLPSPSFDENTPPGLTIDSHPVSVL